jgi:selenocysteine-specific elongation factor
MLAMGLGGSQYMNGILHSPDAGAVFSKSLMGIVKPCAMGDLIPRVTRDPGYEQYRLRAAYVEEGRLASRGGYYATLDHQPRLSGEQQSLFDGLVAQGAHPLLPAPLDAVLAAVRTTKIAGASKAFDTLLARGALVRVGDGVYRGAQIAQIRNRVETHLAATATRTAAQFRDLLGTSRKYAVPLLEWLDARGITVRDGDLRRLRKSTQR